jgi:signal transduction histidine kinase
MIDSMDTAGQDMAVGLGMFRSRLDPRLRAMGLQVHWDTHNVPEGLSLGPEGVLQVFRILQEAIQNALKHAQAKTLWIEARLDGSARTPSLLVSVRDDGVGLPAATPGLDTIRRRAEALSATLTVEPAHPGTRVTLSVPAPR